MIVLDRLQDFHNNTIVVPPFHTGHLGLLPETQVQVSLIASEDKRGCEIIITPYQLTGDLFNFECILKDKPGVVGKLISAISYLGINILTQESSCIDHMARHYVCLLLDWKYSNIAESKILNYYSSSLGSIIPTNDKRYLLLFQEILLRCSDDICWTNEYVAKPKIFIRPFTYRNSWKTFAHTATSTEKANNCNISIKISDSISEMISVFTECDNNSLRYSITSEPESKTLRAIFPHSKNINRLVHVGFKHKDTPGALYSIMQLVADSGFNIISGLTRKEKFKDNTWEVLLEDIENNDEKLYATQANVCKTVKLRLENSLKDETTAHNMNAFEVEINAPKYPKPKSKISPIMLYHEGETPIQIHKYPDKISPAALREKYVQEDASHEKVRYVEILFNSINRSDDKSVFLSCPTEAAQHSELLCNTLHDYGFSINRSVNVASGSIVEDVIAKIKKSKFFIGIWHPETKTGNIEAEKETISPWMYFEYGMAKALGKKVFIMCHEGISPTHWKRIEGDFARFRYSDLTFAEIAIQITLETLEKFSYEIKQKNIDT